MITLHKENNRCQVQENGQPLGWIELSRNPYHAANCYLKIELNRLEPAVGRQLWPKLRELAYVCSRALPHFARFAQSLLPAMFQQHPRIAFECDDCAPAAMLLKNLFANQSDTGFCTYIYE